MERNFGQSLKQDLLSSSGGSSKTKSKTKKAAANSLSKKRTTTTELILCTYQHIVQNTTHKEKWFWKHLLSHIRAVIANSKEVKDEFFLTNSKEKANYSHEAILLYQQKEIKPRKDIAAKRLKQQYHRQQRYQEAVKASNGDILLLINKSKQCISILFRTKSLFCQHFVTTYLKKASHCN